jgi:hypothetical protein
LAFIPAKKSSQAEACGYPYSVLRTFFIQLRFVISSEARNLRSV